MENSTMTPEDKKSESTNYDGSGFHLEDKYSSRIRWIILFNVMVLLTIVYFSFKSHPAQEKHPLKEESFDAAPSEMAITLTAPTAVTKTAHEQEALPNNNRLALLTDQQVGNNIFDDQTRARAVVDLLNQRLHSPLMVYRKQKQEQEESVSQSENPKNDTNVSGSLNKIQVNSLKPLNHVIAEGTLFKVTLETAIQSDLPGLLRAIVSEPVYSEDGTTLLIPAGSRLMGSYKNNLSQGATRLFIVWERVITPQGLSIRMNFEGIDPLGKAGSDADAINRHFFERFGHAGLLSLISAGSATVGVDNTEPTYAVSSYRQALSQSFANTATNTLQQESNQRPTIMIHQGKELMVFVTHDIVFKDKNEIQL